VSAPRSLIVTFVIMQYSISQCLYYCNAGLLRYCKSEHSVSIASRRCQQSVRQFKNKPHPDAAPTHSWASGWGRLYWHFRWNLFVWICQPEPNPEYRSIRPSPPLIGICGSPRIALRGIQPARSLSPSESRRPPWSGYCRD